VRGTLSRAPKGRAGGVVVLPEIGVYPYRVGAKRCCLLFHLGLLARNVTPAQTNSDGHGPRFFTIGRRIVDQNADDLCICVSRSTPTRSAIASTQKYRAGRVVVRTEIRIDAKGVPAEISGLIAHPRLLARDIAATDLNACRDGPYLAAHLRRVALD
jgi:hypothetical protein